jgi:hypothetical protein
VCETVVGLAGPLTPDVKVEHVTGLVSTQVWQISVVHSCLPLGLGKILVARELARLVASSARLDSARFNFITS